MARNDVTIRINARDNASATLKQVAQSSQKASKALDSLSGLKNFAIDTASITAGIAGFEALTTAIHNTIGAVGTFYTSMETNQVGMAGILSSMTTLKGNALDFNTAMGISGSIMKKLNDEALRTAATSEELVNTFRALLGPGLGAGMDVDQIIQLTTTGVNAVKSLGLDGTQLVQELRDLVQGGIQPASSTLATALGLTDKDIEAAKSSSQGLFNFLMERLEGFRQASEYTQNTFKGKFDQIKEGLTRGVAEGFEPIFEAVKAQMGEIGNYLLPVDETTKQIQINPQFINDLQYIANESLIIGGNIKEMFTPIASVGLPAITAFGNALVYVGENIQSIGLGLATWYVLRNISTYYVDITAAATGATTANTALGKAVLSVKTAYTEQALSARQTYTEEMLAAQQAATTVVAEEARKTAARQEANRAQMVAMAQQRTTYSAVQRATQAGYIELANTLQMLKVQYMELGVSTEQAGAMQVQAAKLAKAGQFELAQQVIATQQAHIKNAVAAEASSVAAVSGAGKAKSAVKTLGSAVLSLAGGWLGVAVAIGYATYQLADYIQQQGRIQSYNPNTIIRKNADGTYSKQIEMGPFGLIKGWKLLSPGEMEEHNYWTQWNEKNQKNAVGKPWLPWSTDNINDIGKDVGNIADTIQGLSTKFNTIDDEEEKKKKEKEKKLSQSDIKSQLLSEAGAYAPLIEIAAQDAGIAPEILAALVKKESTFNPNAVSPSGQHFGLGQISTAAANEVGVYGNLFDPQTNLVASARYLAKMMNMFGSNLELGLAAYNAGAGNVQDYGGIPPFAETQDYVATIMGYLKGEGLSGTGNKYITQFAKEKAEQLKAFQQLQAELNSKLTEETGTQYQVGMQKINEEIQKYQEQTRKMSNYGIDVSGLNEQIKQLQDLEKNKVIEKWRKSWQDLKDSIAETNSELTGNTLANYSIEYTKQLDKLDSERKEREKAVMQDQNDAVAKAAVDEWYNKQKELFLKEKNDKVREYLLKEYDLEVEHNKNLIELENNTVEQTNVLNREVLNKKLTYLQTELNRAKLTAQQRIDLENQIYETTRAIDEIDSQNLLTAWPVALKEMQRDTTNYVELIESAFDSIEDNITDNFINMLNGAESFSDGFVDIFENMAKEVQSVVMKQIVQQSIMKPLFGWLGNMIGMGGYSSTDMLTYIEGTGFTFRASGGPVESGSPYIVGEKGKELFIPNTDGTIVPNFKLNDYTATNKVVTQTSTPNVTVNVINQSGQNVTAKQDVKSSSPDNYVINVVLQAITQNKGGMKDAISAVAGRS
ncbi:transglycosylase SLT domain-containing protein [Megamonas sp.]|uniref:transglycosylase SLT domain-containing protein n=1 Tax=Megamonas sp. TaxID=2049033 RepID=UPI00258A3E30|nr:transglycosylase SLT domain-containing protein [Megamonas sp.]